MAQRQKKVFVCKERLKNTGISITKGLNQCRMELLTKAKIDLGFDNVWTIDGQIWQVGVGAVFY